MCEYIQLPEFTLVSFPQACGVGGMRKRQELPAIEDRDKPYVCDSEREPHNTFIPPFPYSLFFNGREANFPCLCVCVCLCHSLWKALQEPPRAELPLHSHTPGRRGRGGRLWATHATVPAQEQPQAWVCCLKAVHHLPCCRVLAGWAGWSCIYRNPTITVAHSCSIRVIPTIHYN